MINDRKLVECGINVASINKDVADFMRKFNHAQNIHSVLMQDDTKRVVTGLIDKITAINPSQLKCSYPYDQFCRSLAPLSMVSVSDLDMAISILDKYENDIKRLTRWAKYIISDMSKYCKHDEQKIIKIRQIVSRLLSLVSDRPDINSIEGFSTIENNSLLWIGLLIIAYFVYRCYF